MIYEISILTTVAALLGLACTVGIGLLISSATSIKGESIRKLIHILTGLWFLALLINGGQEVRGALAVAGALFFIVAVATHLDGRLLAKAQNVGRRSYGQIFFAVAVIGIMLAPWDYAASAIALFMLTLPDAVAGIVGRYASSPVFYSRGETVKTVAGTAAFVLTAVLGLLILGEFLPQLKAAGLNGSFLALIGVVAILGALAETFSSHGSDNLTVPAVSYAAVLILTSF